MNKAIIIIILIILCIAGYWYFDRGGKDTLKPKVETSTSTVACSIEEKNKYCMEQIMNGLNSTKSEQAPYGLLYINGISMKNPDGTDQIGQLILQPINFVPNK